MSDRRDQPYLFIAHNGCDKPRLVRLLGRLLRDGATIFIDNSNDFTEFDAFVARRSLRSIPGGKDWRRELLAAVKGAACTLGVISENSIDPDDPDAHEITVLEMMTARPKLLVIEIEPGAKERLFDHGNVDHRLILKSQILCLRNDRFDRDYDRIGEAVQHLTSGAIVLGGDAAADALARLQAAMAERLCGSAACIAVNHYDSADRAFACRLVPAGRDDAYFWLTERPVVEGVADRGIALAVADHVGRFRLPTPTEIERALAPGGVGVGGVNPFGFATRLSDGVWTMHGDDAVVHGRDEGGPAAIHLVYDA